jgi:chemotaxis signal transduction protein
MQTSQATQLTTHHAQPSEALTALLFRVGGHGLAVPLHHVRYVSPMPVDFVATGAEAAKYFVFEGAPLDYVSLWDLLGLKSEYGEYQEMQTMLPQRVQDHIDWMGALATSIRNHVPFTKARSPYECAFGKWFYGYQAKDRRLALLLGQFEQPHATIHALADRLLGMADAGQTTEALEIYEEHRQTTLANLMRLFDAAGKLVTDLQRRIAIVLEADGETCALGADYVLDIAEVPPERVKPATKRAMGTSSSVSSTLIMLEDQSVVPVLDWQSFAGR